MRSADDYDLNSIAYPANGNPYSAMAQLLASNMYCRVEEEGFSKRMIGLLVVLLYSVLISLSYLVQNILNYKRTKRSIWLIRFVDRPAGRYLNLNQILLFPIFSIICSATFIAYIAQLYTVWILYWPPKSVFYWFGLIWCPFFASLWSTTFAVLSGGNLSSTGRKPNTHVLSPIVANSLYLFLLPIILIFLITFALEAGKEWFSFALLWQEEYDSLLLNSKTWSGSVDPAVQARLDLFISNRILSFNKFTENQNTLMSVFIVSSSILILLNIVGGLGLLLALKRIKKRPSFTVGGGTLSDSKKTIGTGIVYFDSPPPSPTRPKIPSPSLFFKKIESPSPLRLPHLSQHGLSPSHYPIVVINGAASVEPRSARQHEGLSRLGNDITLFFVSVPIILILFIIESVWSSTREMEIFLSAKKFEIAATGMIWVSTLTTSTILSILFLRGLRSKR